MNLHCGFARSRLNILTILVAVLSVLSLGTAQADFGTPGCTNGVGDGAQLAADIAAMNQNGEADTIALAPNCIYDIPSTLVIEADQPLTIEGNDATISGSLLRRVFDIKPGATLTLNRVAVVDGQVASESGGAIRNEGALNLTLSLVSNSSAEFGGGIYNAGTLTATSSTISGNTATIMGGGIYNTATATLINATVTANQAQNGGGIGNGGTATLSVFSSVVSSNVAAEEGGGGKIHGTFILDGSTIAGNSAQRAGGIVLAGSTSGTIQNSTLFGNVTSNGRGGAIAVVSGAHLVLRSTTISANEATAGGAGLYVDSVISSHAAVADTIIANSLSGGDCRSDGGELVSLDGATNLVGDSSCDLDFSISGDPMLGTPQGIPAYFPLQPGSPAIDTGQLQCVPADQRGAARPKDGDGDRIARCDLGAYEADAVAPVPQELLENGDFEVDANADAIPDAWQLKNKSGDKLDCSSNAAAGQCAFVFKGSAAEKGQLVQIIDTSLRHVILAGDRLSLSGDFEAVHPSAKLHLILSVKYADESEPVLSRVVVGPQATYTSIVTPDMIVEAAAIEKIKVVLKHKSKKGKLYVDSLSLALTPNALVRRSTSLPLPVAPETFRGSN